MWESLEEWEGLGFPQPTLCFWGRFVSGINLCVCTDKGQDLSSVGLSPPAWSMHHNTPAGLPVPGCLGDPLPPVGPHVLPVAPPVTHGTPFPSCLGRAFPGDRGTGEAKEDQPRESPVLGAHRAQQNEGRISMWGMSITKPWVTQNKPPGWGDMQSAAS